MILIWTMNHGGDKMYAIKLCIAGALFLYTFVKLDIYSEKCLKRYCQKQVRRQRLMKEVKKVVNYFS